MSPILPDDHFHTFVYNLFSSVCCMRCEIEPDLEWAWNGITTPGEAGVQEFTIKAVAHLKSAGWVMHGEELLCPQCIAKRGLAS